MKHIILFLCLFIGLKSYGQTSVPSSGQISLSLVATVMYNIGEITLAEKNGVLSMRTLAGKSHLNSTQKTNPKLSDWYGYTVFTTTGSLSDQSGYVTYSITFSETGSFVVAVEVAGSGFQASSYSISSPGETKSLVSSILIASGQTATLRYKKSGEPDANYILLATYTKP